MAINARVLAVALCCMSVGALAAQEPAQRLTWVGDEYALRYEVIIEREEAGAYYQELRTLTADSFIAVSLPPGNYRFQVIPYDFLNQPVPVTEWMRFTVFPDEELIVMPPAAAEPAPAPADTPTADDAPTAADARGHQWDIFLSAAWTPFMPLRTNGDWGANGALSPGSAQARLAIAPARRRAFNPGVELTLGWRAYDTGAGARAQTLLCETGIVQQYRLPDERAVVSLRLGLGVSRAADGPEYAAHLTIGASFQYLLTRGVAFALGLDYSPLLTGGPASFLRPWIGLGYRFRGP